MDILDFFRTFYLNHLSPLWGYFSTDFKKIMEHAHATEKFRSARGKH